MEPTIRHSIALTDRDAASDETIKLTPEQADAITDKEMLTRAVDLKHRLSLSGNYDDAHVIAWLLRRGRRS